MAQGFLFAPALKIAAFRELALGLNGGTRPVPATTGTQVAAA
jgi:hypothetical protein